MRWALASSRGVICCGYPAPLTRNYSPLVRCVHLVGTRELARGDLLRVFRPSYPQLLTSREVRACGGH